VRRRLAAVAATLAMGTLAAGCGSGGFSGLYGTPLPGGADLGPHPYRVTADFTDVLDLVPQSAVKVNDVPVGRVEKIDLAADNRTAEVTMAVNGDVRLPGNAEAQLRQSSLLGEKYVELADPVSEQPQGHLADGAVIPVSRTNRNPEIEEVLGALSLLLNGGDIGQLQTIVRELDSAMSGNEPQIRSFLSQVDKMTTDLDAQRAQITNAIDALNRVSGTFVGQQGHIADALDNLGPGLQVIAQQRDQLVTMLKALDKLSGTAVDTVNKSRDDMVTDLRLLQPTLQKLAEAGSNLPKALTYLITYPFPPGATDTLAGDYFNADLYVDMDLSDLVQNMSGGKGNLPGAPPGNAEQPPVVTIPGLMLPTIPAPPPTANQGNNGSGLLGWLLGGH
jgi:phospholipid/cholesterol/gamma-HCH transport system substrate-binding protein